MNVLNRLPIHDVRTTAQVMGETVAFRAFQIIVWVSASLSERLPESAVRFPAILDTGHSHNFSIRESQLRQWGGIDAKECRNHGVILVNRQEVTLRKLNLWIHHNRRETPVLIPKASLLPFPEGISVFSDDMPSAPRLPLLGLRGLVRNHWRLTIEGPSVSISRKELS